MFSLETATFYCNKILQLIINSTCGLLCLTTYWENINSHSWTYKGYIEENKEFKWLSCQVTSKYNLKDYLGMVPVFPGISLV